MKLCVLIPGDEVLNQAGVRIRYGRIAPHLKAAGHDLDLRAIDSFAAPDDFTHDVYLVSKIYDARSLIAARCLAAAGIPLGADLFDDYFSQGDDTRLTSFRAWLNDFAPSASFMLCSTPAMQAVATRYAPHAPSLAMNDPAPAFDAAAIEAALVEKLKRTRQTGILRVGWFGIGDNPYFPVGLADLAHFADALAGLRGGGFDIALSIVANPRSLTADTFAMLSRLPVPYEVIEWSEAAETKLLAESFVCFLPVNGQAFSTAKSLNRAVTCLTAGTQVLTAGHPLYRPFDPLLYRDGASLLADLARGEPVLRAATLPDLLARLGEWADGRAEAGRLAAFLEGVPRPAPHAAQSVVVHGHGSGREIHRYAQALGALSVASPLCTHNLAYDIRIAFADEAPGLSVLVSEPMAAHLGPEQQAALGETVTFADRPYRLVDIAKAAPGLTLSASALGRSGSLAAITACYPAAMNAVRTVLGHLIPNGDVIVSEASRLPWRAGSASARRAAA